MVPVSRLLNFIDNKNGFIINFLEGQKLIQDLVLTQDFKNQGLSYFRDSILTAQQLISFLRPGEGLGLYIDSNDPYFRLKLETNESGKMRTLLLPANFNESPKKITGQARLSKLLPGNSTPYNSVIVLKNESFDEIVNKILIESYQVKAKIFVSNESDQSILIMKLPNINVDKESNNEDLSIDEYWMKTQKFIREIFISGEADSNNIVKIFEQNGFEYLKGRNVEFHCSCSHERMLLGVSGLCVNGQLEEIFRPEENHIETKCDYCKTTYNITREEVKELLSKKAP